MRRGGQFGSPKCFLQLRLTKTTCPLFPWQKCVLTGDSQHDQGHVKYTVAETQVQSINKHRGHVENSPVREMNEDVFAVLAKHFGHILTVFTELSRKSILSDPKLSTTLSCCAWNVDSDFRRQQWEDNILHEVAAKHSENVDNTELTSQTSLWERENERVYARQRGFVLCADACRHTLPLIATENHHRPHHHTTSDTSSPPPTSSSSSSTLSSFDEEEDCVVSILCPRVCAVCMRASLWGAALRVRNWHASHFPTPLVSARADAVRTITSRWQNRIRLLHHRHPHTSLSPLLHPNLRPPPPPPPQPPPTTTAPRQYKRSAAPQRDSRDECEVLPPWESSWRCHWDSRPSQPKVISKHQPPLIIQQAGVLTGSALSGGVRQTFDILSRTLWWVRAHRLLRITIERQTGARELPLGTATGSSLGGGDA